MEGFTVVTAREGNCQETAARFRSGLSGKLKRKEKNRTFQSSPAHILSEKKTQKPVLLSFK